VVSIDGIGVERFDGLIALRSLLREDPGTRYVFVVERDGEPMELTLVLRDLYENSEE
jgi:S1-C subfamily serine protease